MKRVRIRCQHGHYDMVLDDMGRTSRPVLVSDQVYNAYCTFIEQDAVWQLLLRTLDEQHQPPDE